MPPPASRPRMSHDSAMTAINWSPSIMRPFSSTTTTRSASPSSAMPISARTSLTLRIRSSRAVDAGGATDLLGRGEKLCGVTLHQLLDRLLLLVGKLVAVRPEQFDAIVAEGVVRGRDHHAEIRAE